MNKSRVASCILAVMFMISLAGCGFIGEQRYTCDVENVKSVQIIKLGEYDEESCWFQQTTICEIENRTEFIERLLGISQTVRFGLPGAFYSGDIVIYIEYVNGDYDLISYIAQTKVENGVGNGGGHITFNPKQFNALLNDYLPEDEQIH